MENKLVEITVQLKEIESALLVLQEAIENENEKVTMENVNDILEIVIPKMSKTRKKLTNAIDEIFT